MRATFAVIMILASTSAMAAGSSAGYDGGGRFERFDPVVRQYNQSGELFRIVGHCQSACTLFLAIRNVCIEPGANLLFHAGHNKVGQISAAATNHMLSAYNPVLQTYLLKHHAMETKALYGISGRDMIQKFGYRRCP